MYIIVGLGNHGKKYENTRHNVGFMMIDRLKKLGLPKANYLLVKPHAFMNQSGEAVRKIVLENSNCLKNLDFEPVNIVSDLAGRPARQAYQPASQQFRASIFDSLWVIHDDLDLSLGTVRIKFGGSSAGHKGVQSMIDAFDSGQFWRIRVGVGRPETSQASESSYVLSPFDEIERPLVTKVIDQTAKKLLRNLKKGSIVNETFRVS